VCERVDEAAWSRLGRSPTAERPEGLDDVAVRRILFEVVGDDLVEADRIYVDHGLTGTNRERPGLREALAACRARDTLVVTKLDRLARSLPDARAIAEELTNRKVSLSLGGSAYDPTDAVGRLMFNVLAMVAEFYVMWTQRVFAGKPVAGVGLVACT